MTPTLPRHPRSIPLAVLLLGLVAEAAGAQAHRNVVINQVRLPDTQVGALEQKYHFRFQDGAYWYDKVSGAWGLQGGPTVGIVLAGLDLGGPLRADASNGQTGVFINGRELHPLDVAGLQRLTPVYPGRYWVDALGNVGFEGGPAVLNLYALARAQAQEKNGGWSAYSSDGRTFTGKDSDGCYFFNSTDAGGNSTSWSSDRPGC